jgi:PhnB protein
MSVQFKPDDYHTVTPYLIVQGAPKLLAFLKQVFDAKERFIMPGPDGGIGHAEVAIGDSVIMFADSSPRYGPRNAMLYLYVADVDATYKRALEAGATSVHEPADQFYGDRSAGVEDAFGIHWGIATHVEDVPPEEIEKRAKAYKPAQS